MILKTIISEPPWLSQCCYLRQQCIPAWCLARQLRIFTLQVPQLQEEPVVEHDPEQQLVQSLMRDGKSVMTNGETR